MTDLTFTDYFIDWLWIAGGVVIAVIFPVLSTYVKSVFGRATAAGIDFRKYGALALFAAVTAVLVLAIYRTAKPNDEMSWFVALLAGYAWEATVEKWANQ